VYILVYLTAQKNGRETQASGIGWELFKNYLIAKEKFRPDYFLYENNKSAAEPIKAQIRKELGVYDGTLFTPYSDVRFTDINSSLLSAQNRQRFYITNFGDIEQPRDRGILLRDVLESGAAFQEKSYCLTATEEKGSSLNHSLEKHVRTCIAEPVCPCSGDKAHAIHAGYAKIGSDTWYKRVYSDNANKQQHDYVAEPVCLRYERSEKAKQERKKYEAGETNYGYHELHELQPRTDGKKNTLTTVQKDNMICEPVRIGTIESGAKNKEADSQQYRVYSAEGGAKTGLYAVPYNGGAARPIYEVRNGYITIKDKQYPIKLRDGYYIIRKLTVTECCRLQTLPDDYCRAVSASQGYKGLGNGWTAEVIIHLLNHAHIPLDEEIQALSMYDGIGTGRYCLDKMGYKNVKYHAYEIDKYAMQVANSNYPDIIQHGDAFQVRDDNWRVGKQSEISAR
jgi:site-specific DNA-cytosine methylase